MKKIFKSSIFIAIFSFLTGTSLFADFSAFDFQGDLLSRPSRYFEIGTDSDETIANNAFGLKDVLQKNIVLDLTKLAKDLSSSGFTAGIHSKDRLFINLNLSSRFRFSIFTEVEENAYMNISKDLFEILGEGLSKNQSKTVDVEGYGDIYTNIGFSFQTLIKSYGVKITPVYFIPLLHIPKTTATGKITTSQSGAIRAEAESYVDIYTSVDMHDFMENEKKIDNLDLTAGNFLSNGGFDLSLEIERNWLNPLNAGLYARIPIFAGTLKHKMSTKVYAWAYETNALGYFDNTEDHDTDYGHTDFQYYDETYKVYRPLKLGLNATYMPFGDWFKIKPAFGFALRNPYTSGQRKFYLEYALDLRISLVKHIFNFNLGTAYQNQIFQQRFGFGLNFRVIEILAQASICGTSFTSSFTRKGYGGYVGLRIGF